MRLETPQQPTKAATPTHAKDVSHQALVVLTVSMLQGSTCYYQTQQHTLPAAIAMHDSQPLVILQQPPPAATPCSRDSASQNRCAAVPLSSCAAACSARSWPSCSLLMVVAAAGPVVAGPAVAAASTLTSLSAPRLVVQSPCCPAVMERCKHWLDRLLVTCTTQQQGGETHRAVVVVVVAADYKGVS